MKTLKKNFTHLDKNNKAVMVNIDKKIVTKRIALAKAKIILSKKIFNLLVKNNIPKGDVLTTAKLAGIMAAKKTSSLIPLCHPLNIENIEINFQLNKKKYSVEITAQVLTHYKTGVEMEALTAVSIAALTIYDMCKGIDKNIIISDIYLEKKTGGKSGEFVFKKKS